MGTTVSVLRGPSTVARRPAGGYRMCMSSAYAPSAPPSPTTLSAVQLARAIRAGELTSLQAVEAHVERIEAVNPRINAVVGTRYEQARQEARRADARLAQEGPEQLPPLHGVPCTIKECFALTGMPQTAGLVSRRGYLPQRDATAVARLRAAGAIPLGVTNVSELCMWMETDNEVYGRTRNPYDLGRIVGGSSGGEAAVVASGGSPFGLGSDVGGSIRGPAFFNGVFGHKPTGGTVPGTGQFPIAENEGLRYLCSGPLCRRAEDLMPLLRLLAGPDGQDAGCEAVTLGDPSDVDLSTLRVVNVEGIQRMGVDDELLAAQRRAADALSAQGAQVRTVSVDALEQQFEIWSAMLSASQDHTFAEMMGLPSTLSALWELIKWCFGRSEHHLMASTLALVDVVPRMLPGLSRKAIEAGQELRGELVELIGEGGVMLYPSYSTTAPVHGEPARQAWRRPGRSLPFAYQAIFNVMELPVTQVPLGLDTAGLPLGVQVVGLHGADHLTIGVAMALERAMGGWVEPELGRDACKEVLS